MKRIMKALRRFWSSISQPGTGGLIQPGDWRVRYPDGQLSRYVSFGDASNLKTLFGGKLEWRHDLDMTP